MAHSVLLPMEEIHLTEGENLWRNNDLSQINLDGTWDSISTGWFKYSFSLSDSLSDITALANSKTNPAHRLYFGTDNKKIYRMDDANTGDPAPVEITSTIFPSGGYVSGIAVHPTDGNKIMAVFSNYSVYSIFYSEDAGTTWAKVAGNLEQNSGGTGNGPSIRYAAILPKGDSTLYLVATSTGLYATDSLNTAVDSTVWVQQGANTIGNVVVTMIDTRESDGFIAVATHGNGVFTNTAYASLVSFADEKHLEFQLYPNPAKENVTLSMQNAEYRMQNVKLEIHDVAGKLIYQLSIINHQSSISIDVSRFSTGIYYCCLISGNKKSVRKFMVCGK